MKRLEGKPLSEQWTERRAVELGRLSGETLGREDKVYLVGHGGTSTLGGLDPIDLAIKVRKKLNEVSQINLVMCGDESHTLNCADQFAHELRQGGYGGKVYAYTAPVKVDGSGHKYIPDFESSKILGREAYNLTSEAKREMTQAAGDD